MASDQQFAPGAAREEWRRHWTLVVTSILAFSLVAMGNVSAGAFIAPLEKAFGWGRSEATAGLLLYSIVSIVGQPVTGRLIDRFGPRPIALTGIVAIGITFALLATANGALGQWLALWLLYSLTAQLMLMPTWATAVSSEFEAGRGLALAATLSGGALATLLVPLASTLLIEHYGWRNAYVIMGLVPSAVALLLAWRFFYSRRDRMKAGGGVAAATEDLAGLTMQEAIRSPTFYKLLFGTLFSYALMVGTMLHMIPLLSASGLGREQAAVAAGTLGITTVIGKLICGSLVNRVPGHYLSATVLALAVVTFLALMVPSDSVILRSLAIAPLGFALGGQLEMVVYLTTRHFGLRAFGSIFGVITIGLTASSGAGPFIAGWLFDISGGYQLMLTVGIPLALFGSLVMLSIGHYPELADKEGAGTGQASAA
jgi:MFS family permease